MHVSEDDLILHFYGEGDHTAVERHLTTCAECRTELDRLRRVLALVDEQPIPDPPPAFERQVWARLQPQLTPARGNWLPRWFDSPVRLAWAGGMAILLVAAFVAGRFSRPDVTMDPEVASTSNDRVLVVAVVDHLDRSQMMLVELLNGALDDPTIISSEQSRARELVSANRLYRLSAAHMGDEVIGETLEDLERVLLEIANAPADVTPTDRAALRERIESRGLLFRVRVVQSEMRERERNNRVIG